jgi:glycosyltransferase involved in cell wall biosynthesis
MPNVVENSSARPDSDPSCLAATSPYLISVVITCYNQAQFLSDAIESVLAQSWTNIELIVVDDGSTDGTSMIAQQFPAVRCLRQPNKGLAAARNAGLACSTGQYIAFLDADDRLLPNALQQGVECLLANSDYAFVHGDYRKIAHDGSPVSPGQESAITRSGYVGLLHFNYIGMHGAVLYRRDILESIGGFDPSLPACEDYEAYLRIARTYPFGYHPHVVAEVRPCLQRISAAEFSAALLVGCARSLSSP